MDVQLKRGLLDICVLAAIRSEDSYGYQIVRDLSAFVPVTESTLYPILRRLEGAGALTVYSVEHSGRLRKFYHMTPLLSRQQHPAYLSFPSLERTNMIQPAFSLSCLSVTVPSLRPFMICS